MSVSLSLAVSPIPSPIPSFICILVQDQVVLCNPDVREVTRCGLGSLCGKILTLGCDRSQPQISVVALRKEMFYLTTHSTHFIYGYMASDIWLRTIQIVREETRCHHTDYSFRLTARVLLYAPSHRQDSTYHILCYTSRGALAGTRNSSMGMNVGCDRSQQQICVVAVNSAGFLSHYPNGSLLCARSHIKMCWMHH